MATIKLVEEADATGQVARVYEDIKRAFGLNAVPNLFKAMLAVSATNGCGYCVHAHTAALRRLGLGDPEIAETMAVVDLFKGLNKLAEGLQIEPDLK